MLEEDTLRFDAFLKENDEKVQEAIKRADAETRAKNDKVSWDSWAWWLCRAQRSALLCRVSLVTGADEWGW